MKRSGFTIVEIIITVTVMGILLGLAVVNISSSQVRARDEERKSDVESIAQHMESFYRNGAGVPGEVTGRYPSLDAISSISSIKELLPNIDVTSLAAPDVNYEGGLMSLIAATNTYETVGGVEPAPAVYEYVYQPLSWNGSAWTLCTGSQECRKFNIFYRLEADDEVYKVESRNK